VAALAFKACGVGFAPSPIELDFTAPMTQLDESLAEVATTVPTPARGGTLQLSMPLPNTLNPLLNSDPHLAQILRLIFEPLVVFDEGLRPVPNPAIVENISFVPSGQAFTITLHDGIYWEDGVAISSADIAFSIDVLRNSSPQSAIYRANVAAIASQSIIDTRTIHVNLYAPMWRMMYFLDFPIIPAHYYTGVSMTSLAHPRNMHPIGNGAFRFYAYTLASHMELFANDNAPAGRTYIDWVNVTVIRDAVDFGNAFERGITDAYIGQTAAFGRMRAAGHDAAGHMAASDFDFIGFNHGRTTFSELGMRQLVANAVSGNVLPVHADSWLAYDAPALPETSFYQLGFRVGEHGILERQLSVALPMMPLIMSIIVNEDNLRTLPIARSLQAEFTAQGAAVNLYILPPAEFLARLEAGDFDIMLGTIELGLSPNMEFLRTGNRTGGNLINHSSAEFDRILDGISLATNANAFSEAVLAAQLYLHENLPIIGLGFASETLYVSGRLHGNLAPAPNHKFFNIQSWFIVDR